MSNISQNILPNVVTKASILIGGGLGDCIWQYLTADSFKKLLSIKQKNNIHVTCYVHSLNDKSVELVKLNPYINDIIVEEYMVPPTRNILPLNLVYELQSYDAIQMPIFIDCEEEKFVESVKKQGEYVVIHPFAGEKERIWTEYVGQVIKSVVERNLNVVIIGGDSTRKNSEQLTECINESFPRTFNLVNKCSIRVCCDLIRNCKYFIGSHSCYLMAAWAYNVPSMCVTNDCMMGYMIPHEDGCVKPLSPNISNLFYGRNSVVFYSQMHVFDRFLDQFLGCREKQYYSKLIRKKKCGIKLSM